MQSQPPGLDASQRRHRTPGADLVGVAQVVRFIPPPVCHARCQDDSDGDQERHGDGHATASLVGSWAPLPTRSR